ncbi:hypothetical protein PoB_001689800 [Plakobranchus ocellatus]|uniref:Uncharacterized protein n=1 Tax=Plakobranchus ocellatus TaxID=259542 RepID=A0AAV3Z6S1_9GAST|nr:hypothetical protein PoB_001689800 [Plakobranchus ocellatus]
MIRYRQKLLLASRHFVSLEQTAVEASRTASSGIQYIPQGKQTWTVEISTCFSLFRHTQVPWHAVQTHSGSLARFCNESVMNGGIWQCQHTVSSFTPTHAVLISYNAFIFLRS